MTDAIRWSKAFAIQARSDFFAREQLVLGKHLPQCHQLHYLQMAMEKLAKAHRIAGGSSIEEIRKSHGGIERTITTIMRQVLGRTPGTSEKWILEQVRSLARRIELLHPAVRAGESVPANCEYPWLDGGGQIRVPAEYNFAIDLTKETVAVKMLKAVYEMAAELANQEIPGDD